MKVDFSEEEKEQVSNGIDFSKILITTCYEKIREGTCDSCEAYKKCYREGQDLRKSGTYYRRIEALPASGATYEKQPIPGKLGKGELK